MTDKFQKRCYRDGNNEFLNQRVEEWKERSIANPSTDWRACPESGRPGCMERRLSKRLRHDVRCGYEDSLPVWCERPGPPLWVGGGVGGLARSGSWLIGWLLAIWFVLPTVLGLRYKFRFLYSQRAKIVDKSSWQGYHGGTAATACFQVRESFHYRSSKGCSSLQTRK